MEGPPGGRFHFLEDIFDDAFSQRPAETLDDIGYFRFRSIAGDDYFRYPGVPEEGQLRQREDGGDAVGARPLFGYR